MSNNKKHHNRPPLPKAAAPEIVGGKDVALVEQTTPEKNSETSYGAPRNGMEKTMTEGKAKFEKLTQDAAAAGKDNVEAIVKSGGIFAKGFEEFFKAYTTIAQSAAERNAQAFKALLSTKTLTEFTELQSSTAQANFDDFLTGVTKLSELGTKLATETLEPINDQVSKTIKKASESLAA